MNKNKRINYMEAFWNGALGVVITVFLIAILSGIYIIMEMGILLALTLITHVLIFGCLVLLKK